MDDTEKVRRHRHLVILGPFTPTSDAELDAVEREIGRPLPASYRSLVLVANGSRGLGYAVSLPPGGGGEPIQFELTPVDRLVQEWRTYIPPDPSLPVGHLPIGVDGGGSLLLLDLREPMYGAVRAFVTGLPTWAGGDGVARGGLVADDVEGFLDLLEVDDDLAEIVWEDFRDAGDPSWRHAVEAWLDAGLPDWRGRPWADA